MWEVFTLVKEQPYSGMSDQDVVKDAIKGKSRKLLVKPAACPPEVYDIMFTCWHTIPGREQHLRNSLERFLPFAVITVTKVYSQYPQE